MEDAKRDQVPEEVIGGGAVLTGATTPAVHQNGESVYFGLQLQDKPDALILADHHRLGGLIEYLQAIAFEAKQRRMAKGPDVGDLEVSERKRDLMRGVEFQVDPGGQIACFDWITEAGTKVEAQGDYTLIARMCQHLLILKAEMERRQRASAVKQ